MEIKNTKLQDYIKTFDSVLKEEVLDSFLEICQSRDFQPAKIVNPSKRSNIVENLVMVDTKTRKTDVWELYNTSKSLTTVHWFNLLRHFFSIKYYEYMESFKNSLIGQPQPMIYDLQVLKYKEEFFYTYHISKCTQNNRQWSGIFFVNDDYEGGDLVISTTDGGVQHKIKKKKNRLVIWPSNFMYPHTVLPVTKGIRYSVVSWAQ